MGFVKLSPEEADQLRSALLSAFPSKGSLEQVAYFQLGENLDELAGGNNLNELVRSLIVWAETHERTPDLIAGTRKVNAGNSMLRRFASAYMDRRSARAPGSAPPGHLYNVAVPAELRHHLMNLLLRHPATASFEGRSSLLIGLPWAVSLNRSVANARLDLEMMVDQLHSLGHLESSSQPLLLLIDNALAYSRGTTLGSELNKVRDQLERTYGGASC